MAWGWLQIAIGVVCLYLLYRGLRVKKLDSHPHCRKCLYDLSGRPRESTQCPECGLDITRFGNIVRGYTRRQWRWVVCAVLLAMGAVVVDRTAWPWAKNVAGRSAQLRRAISERDDVAVRRILKQNPTLMDRPEEASYCLSLAIRSRAELVVTQLLQDPRIRAGINVAGPSGNTPLWDAIDRGTPSMIADVISAGADAMQKSRAGLPPTHAAMDRPNAWLLQTLIDAGADPQAVDENGQSALHRCARSLFDGRSKVDALIDSGRANLEAHDNAGDTPLAIAMRCNEYVAWRLLKHGADLLARNNAGVSVSRAAVDAGRGANVADVWAEVVLAAVANGRLDHARRLVRAEPWLLSVSGGYERPYPLRLARRMNVKEEVGRKRIDALKLLMEEGLSVQTADARGDTLLHVAARDGDGEMFRFLLEQGADENARNAAGQTPLDLWPSHDGRGILRLVRGTAATTQRTRAETIRR